ncbi:MAG: hypothetical protein JXA30_13440 [Deltaproteobacteria bacterium]|nr:hypothetical protein [Deltaproteobacteria bacterium]
MSLTNWTENLKRNCERIDRNRGPGQVIVVSGTETDRLYWRDRFNVSGAEMFRENGSTRVLSIHEADPKGNFLGTLNAWQHLRAESARDWVGKHPDDVVFTSMVFGKGTRLSPFTQTLGNCKPRFPTPYKFRAKEIYLSIGELSTRYSNLLIGHLADGGFPGMVVKWGDEIVLPGSRWHLSAASFREVDAFRFVWFTEPTLELAREKDWILVNADNNSMRFQLARQNITSLLQRARTKSRSQNARLGVNLGSLGISYDFLDTASEVFSREVQKAVNKIDWDPYVWLALACENEQEWRDEIEYESRTGAAGLADLLANHPDFFAKITRVKQGVEQKNKRPFTVKALDFGEVFWTDFGQHLALRQNLDLLLEQSDPGKLIRELFALPQERDARGNTVVNSTVHPQARVYNSLIVDSTIETEQSEIDRGIVVASRHHTASMPHGGISLFCTARDLAFHGPNAVAFNSIIPALSLPEGGRHSTIVTPDGVYQLYCSEAITNYKGENYSGKILDNEISFAEANRRIEGVDQATLDRLRGQEQAAALKMF